MNMPALLCFKGPLSAINAVRIQIADKYRSTNQVRYPFIHETGLCFLISVIMHLLQVHLPLSFHAAELSMQDFQVGVFARDFLLPLLRRGAAFITAPVSLYSV